MLILTTAALGASCSSDEVTIQKSNESNETTEVSPSVQSDDNSHNSQQLSPQNESNDLETQNENSQNQVEPEKDDGPRYASGDSESVGRAATIAKQTDRHTK